MFVRGYKNYSTILVANLLLSVTLLGIGMLAPNLAFAAEPQAAGQGIQISPVLVDLNAEKSGVYTLKLTVTNVTAGRLVLKSSVADFRAKDEFGTPTILSDSESSQSPSYSFRKWVSPIPDMSLASKESRQVSVKVSVPDNAEAGGHYGVIRFSGVPPELAKQNVALTASVGVLVLARVEGQITEQLFVKQLFVEQGGKKKALPQNGPLDITTRIENAGNVHVKPSGILTIKNFFGSTIATLPLTKQPKNILPHSIRRFQQTLPNKWLFGRYTITVNASYGTTGKTLAGGSSFWVIPYKIIFVFVAMLALAILLARRSLKRYNAKVIKRHQQSRKP